MHTVPSLSEREWEILVEYVARTEYSARRHRITLTSMSIGAALCGILAFGALAQFWTAATMAYDPTDRLQESETPSADSQHLWAAAELRRTAALLHKSNQLQMLQTLEGTIGLILATFTITLAVMIRSRWRDGERMAVLAKVARWQIGRWSQPNAS